jgi:hypothetical protein
LPMSKKSKLSSSLLFSILLRSRASWIKFYKWIAEFLIILIYSSPLSLTTYFFKLSIIGNMLFNGVLSSWAIDEKYIDFILDDIISRSLILVISLIRTIKYWLLLTKWPLIWTYFYYPLFLNI